MKNRRVPAIRFKNFTDDWEQYEFGDIVKRRSTSGNNTKLPGIEYDDLEVETGRLRNNFKDNNEIKKGIAFKEGDILFGKLRPYLKHWFKATFEGVAIGDFWVFYSNFLDSNFIYYMIQTDQYYNVANISTGSKMPRSDWQLVSNESFFIPLSLEEQCQIGAILGGLESLINLHQRKLDKLKTFKKGFLQKLLPKNGDIIPVIRFIGYTDDWETRRLGELASSFEYGLNAAAKAFDGKNKYIRITDIDDNSRKFNQNSITSPDIDLVNADNYKLAEGDILFARTGASVGKTYIYKNSDGLVYYAGFLIRARIKEEYNSEFVFQNTITMDYERFIQVVSMRSGQPGVNAQEYSRFEIMVPEKAEQDRIGKYFHNLDSLVALYQRELELLQMVKKGLLQKLFVSGE